MNNKNWAVLFLLLVLSFSLGMYVEYKNIKYPKPYVPIDYWSKDYKTTIDSLKQKLSEKPIDTSGFRNIKPQIQYVYLPEKGKKPQEVNCTSDSLTLIMDSLKNEILKIPLSFLTTYQNNPKLVSGFFKKDSLELSLFYPNGSSITNKYPMDYDNYNYLWFENNLKANKLDKKPEKSNVSNTFYEIYVNSGILTYPSSYFLNADYEFHYKKFKIETTASYLITPNIPTLSLGIGYKLK
jgi:hypothetical protein